MKDVKPDRGGRWVGTLVDWFLGFWAGLVTMAYLPDAARASFLAWPRSVRTDPLHALSTFGAIFGAIALGGMILFMLWGLWLFEIPEQFKKLRNRLKGSAVNV